MRDRLLKQANREYGPRQRLAVLFAAGILFVVILPLAILRFGRRLDRALGWAALRPRLANPIMGGFMILSGWAAAAEMRRGFGSGLVSGE